QRFPPKYASFGTRIEVRQPPEATSWPHRRGTGSDPVPSLKRNPGPQAPLSGWAKPCDGGPLHHRAVRKLKGASREVTATVAVPQPSAAHGLPAPAKICPGTSDRVRLTHR